ncbi:MAG: metal-sulfur cluster assembly factor, partial [Geodermatophilaceae bacterium]
MPSVPERPAVLAALATVKDPEIRRPITEIGMLGEVDLSEDGGVAVQIFLTVAGCPLKDTLTRDVTTAVSAVPGVTGVQVRLDVMSDEQRKALQTQLRGDAPQPEIPFAKPGS